jgi:hypothetical protein
LDRLYGVVVRAPCCRHRGPCSIPGTARVWNGVHLASEDGWWATWMISSCPALYKQD